MKVGFFAQNYYNSANIYHLKTLSPALCGKTNISADKVKNGIKCFEMSVYNPYSRAFCYDNVRINLSKPQQIVLKNYRSKTLRDDSLTLDYNPQSFGFIKDKIKNKPIKTMILTSKDPYHSEEVGFHFLSEDLQKEYGYVHLSHIKKITCYDRLLYRDILRDYPNLEITGERIIVRYLQNWNDKIVGGIGKLADMMAIKYCNDNGIKQNIVSFAEVGSHIAHFLRGKRFLPLEKNSTEYNNLVTKYGTSDPNNIVQEMINSESSTKSTESLPLLGMYMPKNIIKRYLQVLQDKSINFCNNL